MTTQCAIVGPRMAVRGQSVRLDVVVRDAPPARRLRIRLERLWPEPAVHVDEWSTQSVRMGTTTVSFLWRVAPEVLRGAGRTAVLRATVWADDLLCASTHGVDVIAAGAPEIGTGDRQVPTTTTLVGPIRK